MVATDNTNIHRILQKNDKCTTHSISQTKTIEECRRNATEQKVEFLHKHNKEKNNDLKFDADIFVGKIWLYCKFSAKKCYNCQYLCIIYNIIKYTIVSNNKYNQLFSIILMLHIIWDA